MREHKRTREGSRVILKSVATFWNVILGTLDTFSEGELAA